MDNSEDGTVISDSDIENRSISSAELIKQTDASLIMYLVKSYQPITMVEEQGFIRLVRAMNAEYLMPTRKAITNRILPEMFSKSHKEQKSIVQQAETICLTVDRVMLGKYTESFVGITAHFITPDYAFKSVLLNRRNCEDNSEVLEYFLTDTCTEWEIAGKINWCVTDGGPEIVQAVNFLGWNHRSCIASKLNMVLQKSLELCDETVSKVNMVVHYFDSNLEDKQMLHEYQTKQGIAEPMGLIDSEHTSWYTKYDMIERFLTLQEAIKVTIAKHDDNDDVPDITDEDWIKLKQLCKLLSLFKDVTEELGGDKYTYASIVIPVVNGLKDVLQELRKLPDYYSAVKEIAEYIEKKLNKEFDGNEREPNLALCTILDPRYKLSMFLDASAADSAKLNLMSEVQELLKDGKSPTNLLKTEDRPVMANNDDEGDFSLWRRRTMTLENRQCNANARQEVESYMQENITDSDPCEWWQTNESKFPHLAKLFKTKCNEVATSMPSEQLFTEQGINLCERRQMLSKQTAAMIVFIHGNLKEEDYLRLMPEIDDNSRILPV